MSEEVLLSQIDGHIAVLTLNRPKQRNALSLELMKLLVARLDAFESDDQVRVVVLAGSEQIFSAGADINDMAETTVVQQYKRNQFARWERIKRFPKPLVAAVSGYCLGGACELMMHCDLVIASETAQFGQPEINIGVMPGAGGTQRLTRSVGKALAMDMVLTGRFISAPEALRAGLVSRVVPREHFLSEAMRAARDIAAKGPIAVRLAKEAVLKAQEMPLSEGLEYERKLFYMLFATDDQKEGMRAFLEKRAPQFKGQ